MIRGSEAGESILRLREGEGGNNPAGLNSFEPFDGSLVALLAYFAAHLLRLRGRQVIESDVAVYITMSRLRSAPEAEKIAAVSYTGRR